MVMSLLIATSLLTQSPRSKLLSSRRLHCRFPIKLSTLKVMKKQRTQTSMTNPNSRWVMCTFFVNFKNKKKNAITTQKLRLKQHFFSIVILSKQLVGFFLVWLPLAWYSSFFFFFLGIGNGILQRLVQHQPTQYPASEEMSIGKIKFKAFDLGGHQIARRVWKDYYAKVDRSIYQLSLMRMFS